MSSMQVMVKADRHANLDSLPLRFGIHYKIDTNIQLINCRLAGQDKKHPNRMHYDAAIEAITQYGTEMLHGKFVILESSNKDKKELITVWRNDQDTEFYLSHTMKGLRQNNVLTPEKLLELHPHYKSGKIRTAADLVEVLANLKTQAEKEKINALAEQLQIEAEKHISEIGILNEKIVSLTQDNKLKDEKIMELEETNKRLEADKLAARKNSQHLTLALADMLTAVNVNILHRGSSCTELIMGNGERWYMKTSTFDTDGAITRRAKNLIGQRVRVSSWDPIGEPGKWSRQHYFRNIYLTE